MIPEQIRVTYDGRRVVKHGDEERAKRYDEQHAGHTTYYIPCARCGCVYAFIPSHLDLVAFADIGILKTICPECNHENYRHFISEMEAIRESEKK